VDGIIIIVKLYKSLCTHVNVLTERRENTVMEYLNTKHHRAVTFPSAQISP